MTSRSCGTGNPAVVVASRSWLNALSYVLQFQAIKAITQVGPRHLLFSTVWHEGVGSGGPENSKQQGKRDE